MTIKSTVDMSHDQICNALIQYIERDNDEKVVGKPILFVTTNPDGIVQSCQVAFDVEDK